MTFGRVSEKGIMLCNNVENKIKQCTISRVVCD